jgi:PAB-dependent poly(A)-specific ribonuclease subunit 3
MDSLNDSFGRLSTNAQEWIPGQQRIGQSHQSTSSSSQEAPRQSGLNASSVKEFVPGKGWNSLAQFDGGVTSATSTDHSRISTGASNLDSPRMAHPGAASVPAPPTAPPLPCFRALHSLTLSDTHWLYYRDIALEARRQMDPTDPRHNAVPVAYFNAFCLSDKGSSRSSFGYPCDTFQATSREDGNLYCVRRFDNVRCISPRIAIAVMEKWNSAVSVQEHPGIVPFYRCFLAQRAVFFVHQYIPGARTLRERLEGPLLESVAWSAILQLISAIRVVHTNNLAVRTLQLQHILSNTDPTGSRLRLRLNCLGVLDALEFEARKSPSELQGQDIRDLGRLILSITTGSEVNPTTDQAAFGRCEAFLAQNYSRDLHGLTMTLIKSARPPSILEVTRAVAQRALDEQDAAYVTLDNTESALSAEYESGRALRLLLKLGFVNERPEFGPNRRWSQSGDCYILTLFRDYGK